MHRLNPVVKRCSFDDRLQNIAKMGQAMSGEIFADPALDPARRGSRRAAAHLPRGSLVYLAFIGLVATAVIGVFFGAGFVLLAPPHREAITLSNAEDHADSPAPPDILKVPPAPQNPAAQNSVAMAAVSDASAPPREAAPESIPARQSESEHSSPSISPTVEALAPMPVELQPGSAPAVLPAPIVPYEADRRTGVGRSHHARTASRHWHRRSARSEHAPSSFDQLLTRLGVQPSPSAPSLTPPRESSASLTPPRR
jgi:hypothetical protein